MKLFAIITAGVLTAAGGVYYFHSEGCPFGGCKTTCPAPTEAASAEQPDCCAVKAVKADCCAKVEECCEAVAPCCAEAKVAKAVKADCCAAGADCCAVGAACCIGASNAK